MEHVFAIGRAVYAIGIAFLSHSLIAELPIGFTIFAVVLIVAGSWSWVKH